MKLIYLSILLILFESCSKETGNSTSLLTGKIKTDGSQNYFYTRDTIDYIDNFGNYGAEKVKFFYEGDKIVKIYAYNANGHIQSFYFKYENNKLIQIIDSFVLWNTSQYNYRIVDYQYVDSTKIIAKKIEVENGQARSSPEIYSFLIKDYNIIQLQQGNSIDSFVYDSKTNPRYKIAGFSYLFDFIFLDYIGFSWVVNTNKNNIVRQYGRNINLNTYNVKDYNNEYDKYGNLEKVVGDSKSGYYVYLDYEYYD
jgi:hypothetical protein